MKKSLKMLLGSAAALAVSAAAFLAPASAQADEDLDWHAGWCKKGEGLTVVVQWHDNDRKDWPDPRGYMVRCAVGAKVDPKLDPAERGLHAAGYDYHGTSYIDSIEGIFGGGYLRGCAIDMSWKQVDDLSTCEAPGDFQYFVQYQIGKPRPVPQYAPDPAPGSGGKQNPGVEQPEQPAPGRPSLTQPGKPTQTYIPGHTSNKPTAPSSTSSTGRNSSTTARSQTLPTPNGPSATSATSGTTSPTPSVTSPTSPSESPQDIATDTNQPSASDSPSQVFKPEEPGPSVRSTADEEQAPIWPWFVGIGAVAVAGALIIGLAMKRRPKDN